MADQISSSEPREVSKEAVANEASLHIEESIAVATAPLGPDGKVLKFEAGRPILSHEDEKAMKRLRLKLDLWILPILFIVMLLGSMDRSDVSCLHPSVLVCTMVLTRYISTTMKTDDCALCRLAMCKQQECRRSSKHLTTTGLKWSPYFISAML